MAASDLMKTASARETSLDLAREVMEAEARAIQMAAARMERDNLLRAVGALLKLSGKVIVTGMGKSGHVARKLAATLQSTGTPALFLHPSEAAHGDVGVHQVDDAVLFISNSGSTEELVELATAVREFGCAVTIGILGNIGSPLAKQMSMVLDAGVAREADPGGFVPTSSTAVASAVGDALAIALMQARGFTASDFAKLHGGGHLGRSLKVRVEDAMHLGEEVAWVSPRDSLKAVVLALSKRPLGAACVLAENGALVGLVTDGDVRRAFEAHDDIRTLQVEEVMTKSPLTVRPDALLNEALLLMEDRPSQISVLPVVDGDGKPLGLLRLHDIYHARQK